ncbi:MAG: bifunctional oligoribonuclease/PAP phosphatase NrnA [Phycisphaeraceae bacterium]|nr:MAG: bifunctional oligoribonuclease/PAP phosphatase NrnA [Phycisphaeraceae bacterium]
MNQQASTAPDTSDPDLWSSNTDLDAIAQRLRSARSVLLLTHSRPDGDAIGSTLAVTRTLHKLGIEARPVYMGPWAHRFDEIVDDTPVLRIGGPGQLPGGADEPDVILILDTGSWSQLAEARDWLKGRAERIIVIDHHLHGDPALASMRLIEGKASAACQPAAELCRRMLDLQSASELPVEIAEPLYLGLATDTGWFRHSNVKPAVFTLAGELLKAGVNHSNIYEAIEQSDTAARLCLIGRALASLKLHADNQVAVMSLTRQDFKDCGGELEDSGGVTDLPMSVESVRVAAVLTELDDKLTKLSLRSKPARRGGAKLIDVNQVAITLGGGGHAQASGAKIHEPLDTARRLVIEALTKATG